jgi:hypothetical protein
MMTAIPVRAKKKKRITGRAVAMEKCLDCVLRAVFISGTPFSADGYEKF